MGCQREWSISLTGKTCADPGIFVRGVGVQDRRPEIRLNECFSPQLILQFTEWGPMVLSQRKLYFSKDPEGVQHIPGGPTLSREAQMLISIETHITCDFPGVGGSSESAHVII